jgi:hypothetical protein
MRGKSVRKSPARLAAVAAGFRSAFEQTIAAQLTAAQRPYCYEQLRISYQPAGNARHYTPDFMLDNGIIVECKGIFSAADRTKHLLVKQQRPGYDIRFVFQNANAKLSKKSKTTYAMWCQRNGFLYAHKTIPAEWLEGELHI